MPRKEREQFEEQLAHLCHAPDPLEKQSINQNVFGSMFPKGINTEKIPEYKSAPTVLAWQDVAHCRCPIEMF